MRLEGRYEFEASQQVVWGLLQDPNVIGSIIPGSQGLDEVGENQYQIALVVKVGPVTGRFEGSVELADKNPPDSYKLIMSGKGPAGHVNGEGLVQLEHVDGVTTMHYSGDATVGGKIATVGQRLLDLAARTMAKQSLKALAKQVEARINESETS